MITVSLKRYNIKNTTQKHLIPINKIIPKSKKKTQRQQRKKDKEKRKRETNKKLIVPWSLTKLSNVTTKDDVLNQLGITILWNHYSLKHIEWIFYMHESWLTVLQNHENCIIKAGVLEGYCKYHPGSYINIVSLELVLDEKAWNNLLDSLKIDFSKVTSLTGCYRQDIKAIDDKRNSRLSLT